MPLGVEIYPTVVAGLKRVWLSPNGVEWRIARQNRFSRFGCTLIKERKKFFEKRKKDEPLYVGYVYLRPGKFFRNQILIDCRWRNQSCQIFFQSVCWDVYSKGSHFAIFSVNQGWPLQLLYYRTTVIRPKITKIVSCKFSENLHETIFAIFGLITVLR